MCAWHRLVNVHCGSEARQEALCAPEPSERAGAPRTQQCPLPIHMARSGHRVLAVETETTCPSTGLRDDYHRAVAAERRPDQGQPPAARAALSPATPCLLAAESRSGEPPPATPQALCGTSREPWPWPCRAVAMETAAVSPWRKGFQVWNFPGSKGELYGSKTSPTFHTWARPANVAAAGLPGPEPLTCDGSLLRCVAAASTGFPAAVRPAAEACLRLGLCRAALPLLPAD